MERTAAAEARWVGALRWGALLGAVGLSATEMILLLSEPSTNIGIIAFAGALGGGVGVVTGGVFGALRRRRSRLLWLWMLPVLVAAGGCLYIYLTLWPQSDHGGLATAVLFVLFMVAALAFVAIAAVYSLLRQASARRLQRIYLALAVVMALVAGLRLATAPRARASTSGSAGPVDSAASTQNTRLISQPSTSAPWLR